MNNSKKYPIKSKDPRKLSKNQTIILNELLKVGDLAKELNITVGFQFEKGDDYPWVYFNGNWMAFPKGR